MHLRIRDESLHRSDSPSSMAGEGHDDEPSTHPVHPITLRFVEEGQLSRGHIFIIHVFGLCCVRGQVSRSLLKHERSGGALSAPCHE